jgi:hypothetical protein
MEQKTFKQGAYYRFICGKHSFLQVNTMSSFAGIERRYYPHTGIENDFLPENGWEPCSHDEFVEAYCTAINAISAASGIEHLPLQFDFLTESNPES